MNLTGINNILKTPAGSKYKLNGHSIRAGHTNKIGGPMHLFLGNRNSTLAEILLVCPGKIHRNSRVGPLGIFRDCKAGCAERVTVDEGRVEGLWAGRKEAELGLLWTLSAFAVVHSGAGAQCSRPGAPAEPGAPGCKVHI